MAGNGSSSSSESLGFVSAAREDLRWPRLPDTGARGLLVLGELAVSVLRMKFCAFKSRICGCVGGWRTKLPTFGTNGLRRSSCSQGQHASQLPGSTATTYISMSPAMTPGAPYVSVVSESTCTSVTLEEILKNTGRIREAGIPIFFQDEAIHFFHSKCEGVKRHHTTTHFPQVIATRLFIEAAEVFDPVDVVAHGGGHCRR